MVHIENQTRYNPVLFPDAPLRMLDNNLVSCLIALQSQQHSGTHQNRISMSWFSINMQIGSVVCPRAVQMITSHKLYVCSATRLVWTGNSFYG